MTDPRVCIVSASRQNIFFTELLDAFAAAIADAGLTVERFVDRFPEPDPDVVCLFVPHEYMPLVRDEAHPTEAQLRRSVALCTEQPGTSWFDETARIAARAGAAVDVNPLGAQELGRRGINARFVQLGYVPDWDLWHGDESAERPVDVAFMGGYTDRRARILARCGPHLVDRTAEMLLFESHLPHQANSVHFLSGERKWQALRRAKVIINVHRSELGYLEWQRVIGAMENGCVVVTEHSRGYEPLVPGEHFVSVSYDSIASAIATLLADPERVAAIRSAAYRLLVDDYPLTKTVAPLVQALQEVAAAPFQPGIGKARGVPAPAELALPPSEPSRILSADGDLDIMRMAIKELLLNQRELGRRIDDLAAGPAPRRDHLETHGPSVDEPRVSVVLTLHNYADVVGEAIDSVAACNFDSHELIVVEDASTDDSLDAARAALARCPWLPATIVARARNGGLPAARNLGVERARGEYVFMLDADNAIYPHALPRLVGALDSEPDATFAYGIIEKFGPQGPNGLMSWLGWDGGRLRYGNFVDAMALMRRSALLTVGGYTTDRRLYGWEDFALWCAFNDRGWWGIRVPEILARYRTGHSMISITNIDAKAAWSALLERHDWLLATGETVA